MTSWFFIGLAFNSVTAPSPSSIITPHPRCLFYGVVSYVLCSRIAENQENIRRDILKFLKQFIIIEIQHYCKALEHLTQAYGLAKESEKFIPMSSAEVND